MIALGNLVLGKLRRLFNDRRVFISYDENQEADGLMLACCRSAPHETAVYVHSIDCDLRAMQPFLGHGALFTGIVSILPKFPSYFWQGRAIVDALECSPIVLQTVFGLMGDNVGGKLSGV